MFKVSSNAYALTGDGPAIAYRHGLPLEDMEFFQFHPTGIYRLGILLSRGRPRRRRRDVQRRGRALHGALRPQPQGPGAAATSAAPSTMEVRAGRGIGGKDYVHLDMPPPGQEPRGHRRSKLPDIIEFARVYLGVEPDQRAGADPADGPLRHGRHADRHRRPGRPATPRDTVVPGPLRGRRVRLRERPRRQSAGHQLARRPARLRPARGPRHGRPCRTAHRCRTLARDAA